MARQTSHGAKQALASQALGSPWGDETAVVDALLDWTRRRVVRSSDPKSTARPASELADAAGKTVTPSGIGAREAMRVFEDVLLPATRAMDDPMHLAYIAAAPSRTSMAFDCVVSAANVFGGHWETGAGAIHAENEALAWLVGLLGWPETAGGTFVSGGTTGNLSALATARETARHRLGGRPEGGWRLACTGEAHSSIKSVARLLDADVVEVPDDRGRMTGAALRDVLQAERDAGRTLFAVVATAGTTNGGIIDDLAGVADACAEFGAWMHVDGAYGGAGLAAPSVRDRYDGIERADSFIVDPHKWLFSTYDCCALIYREPRYARAAHTQHAGYLDEVDREQWNPSDLAVQLTRRTRGLPFWFGLATHGTDRYTEAVETTLATSRRVADYIRDSGHLRLLQEPDLSVLLFERTGWTEEQYSAWSRQNAADGVILCVPTRFEGRSVLRLAFVNPMTRADKVIPVLDTLV
ncbi:pyridoxal phosphate-dependent decarboxylase family protein [Actinomadura rupiterrae]|uniref:pyridoxal phosphate-dependent decarboxylase family protein n=1 Tax=Actinomadura rupiterrae TaxID=559627 RepID=UPI0020A372E8|nr:pyridoxal-dependent decarboxylase [Actinomadura rupiterrae]MCP2335993.1 glutamate/tyrosine decarboxylase-like PLP-dependent enzyme [Actinomadura rupiterrae]